MKDIYARSIERSLQMFLLLVLLEGGFGVLVFLALRVSNLTLAHILTTTTLWLSSFLVWLVFLPISASYLFEYQERYKGKHTGRYQFKNKSPLESNLFIISELPSIICDVLYLKPCSDYQGKGCDYRDNAKYKPEFFHLLQPPINIHYLKEIVSGIINDHSTKCKRNQKRKA